MKQWSAIVAAAVVTALVATRAAADTTGHYRLASDEQPGTGIVESMTVRVGQGRNGDWLLLEFVPADGGSFRVFIGGAGVAGYATDGHSASAPGPARYILMTSSLSPSPPTGEGRGEGELSSPASGPTSQAIEFIDERTGRARMPAFFRRGKLVPKCLDANGRFADKITFLGKRYVRKPSDPANASFNIPPNAVRAVLDDDVLIGTSRNFRNKQPGRRYVFGPDYEYVPFTDANYQRMIEAGFNYFDRVTPEQYEWIRALPAFFVIDTFERDGVRVPFPEVLYHPGFLGVEDFVDEPSFLMGRSFAVRKPGTMTPEVAAQSLEDRVRTLYTYGGDGRPRSLSTRLRDAGIEPPPGVKTIVEDLPIWEEHFSTGCYQLRVAGSSFIHEGRYDFPYVPAILNETFRTSIPVEPESTFTIYYAFLRGAARVTGKDWGMAVYGQADPAHAPLALRMAYDRGARQLWFWSSDKSHHLPFEEQLDLAKGIRDHIRANPRRPRVELNRRAEVAIVLPYGFTFPIDDWNKRRLPGLWRSRAFPLDGGRLPSGVSHYAVLQAAARRMEEMIRAGREFDMVIDVPELKDAGYGELIYALDEAEQSRSEFPRWILYKDTALVGLMGLYVVAGLIVRLLTRWRKGVKTWLEGSRPRTFGGPWRLVLPWVLLLALKHHLLTAVGLEHMYIGPQRHDWLTTLYVVAAIVLGVATVIVYWRRHLHRRGPRTAASYAGMVLLSFAVEYELFLWLARGNILA